MKRSEQLKAIKEAYSELTMLGLQDGFFDVAERLCDMNTEAERRHRRGAPNGIRHGLTVGAAARLFTCSHLIDGWDNPRWMVDDILHVRNEVLYAQAYATKHHAELADWVIKWAPVFVDVDYAALQKVA